MRVEDLHVSIAAFEFQVKDDLLYYVDNVNKMVVVVNLLTKEQTNFQIQNYIGIYARILIFGDKIYLQYYLDQINQVGEIEFNFAQKTAQFDVNERFVGGFTMWPELSRSILHSNVEILCLDHERRYEINEIDDCNPVFVHNDRLYYVTKEDNRFYLNFFHMSDENRKTKESLAALNNVDQLCTQLTYSCVFGEEVYFVLIGISRIVKLNLRNKTLEDITGAVGGLSEITFVWGVNQNNHSIYFAEEVTMERLNIRKIDVLDRCSRSVVQANPSQSVLHPASVSLKCPICFEPYGVPKYFPACGHSVCADCEVGIVANAPHNGTIRTVRCPTCRKGMRLPVGEVLQVNYGLKDIIDQLKNASLSAAPTGLNCSTCQKPVEKEELLCCGQCQVHLCGVCVLKDHKNHKNVEFVTFVTDNEKNAVISKFNAQRFEINSMEETLKLVAQEMTLKCEERSKKLKESIQRLKDKANELRVTPNLTKIELLRKEAELHAIERSIQQDITDHGTWTSKAFSVLGM